MIVRQKTLHRILHTVAGAVVAACANYAISFQFATAKTARGPRGGRPQDPPIKPVAHTPHFFRLPSRRRTQYHTLFPSTKAEKTATTRWLNYFSIIWFATSFKMAAKIGDAWIVPRYLPAATHPLIKYYLITLEMWSVNRKQNNIG